MNAWYYLLFAASSVGLLIWDISKHDYGWAIFQGIIGTIMFGLYVQSVIESSIESFSLPKPKRTEHIYD